MRSNCGYMAHYHDDYSQVWDSVMKIIQMVPQKLIVVNNWIELCLENQPELQAYFEEFSSQAESNIDSLLM